MLARGRQEHVSNLGLIDKSRSCRRRASVNSFGTSQNATRLENRGPGLSVVPKQSPCVLSLRQDNYEDEHLTIAYTGVVFSLSSSSVFRYIQPPSQYLWSNDCRQHTS